MVAIHNRVAGLLVRAKKILLVTGYEESMYWTPGGKKEGNESDFSALCRELEEELGVKVVNAHFLTEYEHPTRDGKPAKTRAYLVTWQGTIKPQQEITKVAWVGKAEYEKDEPHMSSGARDSLFPKLIKEKIVT